MFHRLLYTYVKLIGQEPFDKKLKLFVGIENGFSLDECNIKAVGITLGPLGLVKCELSENAYIAISELEH